MDRTWLAAAALVAATATLHPAPAGAFKRLELGQPVADHTLVTPAGEARQLTDLLGSGATAITFWASWSPRSGDALGGLQELRDAFADRGLATLAINVDGPDRGAEDTAIDGLTADVTQLVDADLSLYDEYGVVAVPSLVLLDGTGRVAALSSGYSPSSREQFVRDAGRVLGVAEPEPAAEPATGYRPAGAAQKHLRMARLYLRKHQTARALELFSQALAEDPGFAEARTALAAALRKNGRPDEAARVELAAVESEEYCLVPRRGLAAAQWQ